MITIGNTQDFTPTELTKLLTTTILVVKLLLDPKFIARLMAAKYTSTTDDNATIIKKITSPITVSTISCEDLGWIADHIDHTIAEEDTDGDITCNRPYYDEEDIPALMNTILHEVGHCAGYSHISASDTMSEPYQTGDICEDYARENNIGLP